MFKRIAAENLHCSGWALQLSLNATLCVPASIDLQFPNLIAFENFVGAGTGNLL